MKISCTSRYQICSYTTKIRSTSGRYHYSSRKITSRCKFSIKICHSTRYCIYNNYLWKICIWPCYSSRKITCPTYCKWVEICSVEALILFTNRFVIYPVVTFNPLLDRILKYPLPPVRSEFMTTYWNNLFLQ